MKRRTCAMLCAMMLLTAVGCGEEPTAKPQAETTVTTATTVTAVTERTQSGEKAPVADTAVNTTESTTVTTTAATTKATTVTPTASKTTASKTTAPKTTAPTTPKTTVATKATQPPVVTASLTVRGASGADEAAVAESRKYRLCDSLFAFPVYLEADGDVAGVDVYELELSFEDGMYTRGNKKGSLGGMKDGDKAVVWVEFPGDFSAWCITFTTANGAQKDLSMYLSGEDGSLVVQEGIM